MSKVKVPLSQLGVVAVLIAGFFPWTGLLHSSGVDIARHLIENITASATIDTYAIALAIVLALVSIVLNTLQQDTQWVNLGVYAAVIGAFVYKLIDTEGDFGTMHEGFYVALGVSVLMLLERFGLLRFKR